MRYIEQLTKKLRKSSKQTALVDLDGVVCDNRERLKIIVETVDGKQKYRKGSDWGKYSSKWREDTKGAACNLVEQLGRVYNIVFLTARMETSDDEREELLTILNDWCNVDATGLIMRNTLKKGSKSISAAAYKTQAVEYLLDEDVQVGLFLDDSVENVVAVNTINLERGTTIAAMRFMNYVDSSSMHY